MKKLSALLAFFIGATLCATAADVALYFAPSHDSPVAFRVPETQAALKSAQPAAGSPNWYVVQWKDLYTGWSPKSFAMKDLTLEEKAPIYAAADTGSLMLGRVPPGAQIAVAQVSGDWAKVRFTATMPLYFYKEPVKAAPPPVVLPQAPSAVSDASRGEITGQPRFYKGTLKPRRTMPTFQQAPYDYQLNNLDGEVVGLVDFKDVISSTPTSAYINKKVNIYGVGERIEKYPYCVIRVKFVQFLQDGVNDPAQ